MRVFLLVEVEGRVLSVGVVERVEEAVLLEVGGEKRIVDGEGSMDEERVLARFSLIPIKGYPSPLPPTHYSLYLSQSSLSVVVRAVREYLPTECREKPRFSGGRRIGAWRKSSEIRTDDRRGTDYGDPSLVAQWLGLVGPARSRPLSTRLGSPPRYRQWSRRAPTHRPH